MRLELRGIVTLLEVVSVPDSIAFYRDVLGFDVVDRAGSGEYVGWAWLRHGDLELMLNAMYDRDEGPATPDPARVAAHRDTTLFIGCPDVDGAYEYLRGEGLEVRAPAVTHYGMRQLSFHDPDGYGICLQWRATQGES
jgi:catechol 2,3-dioxygenase-like lactoylglutathione lyase family enzyme